MCLSDVSRINMGFTLINENPWTLGDMVMTVKYSGKSARPFVDKCIKAVVLYYQNISSTTLPVKWAINSR